MQPRDPGLSGNCEHRVVANEDVALLHKRNHIGNPPATGSLADK